MSKLPALPDRLRAEAQSKDEHLSDQLGRPVHKTKLLNLSKDQQHGAVYSSTGYALSLTHTHAFVWPYTATSPSPETFTFALPYPSKHANDPLPLGTLVSPSAANEDPGLVIVMPVSGKIVYWESISSAATLDFIKAQRTGVEDSISGMLTGESVVQIVNAETAGFILVLSSGRLAYMNVRDGHGRPGISVQFLRSGLGNVSGGFLGSLRQALTASVIRGHVAAVRASHGVKVGERVIVAATTKGKLVSWRVHRGGHNELLADVDLRDEMINIIQQSDPAAIGSAPESFELLDFTFVPRGLDKKYVDGSRLSEALEHEEDALQHLLVLASFAGKRQSRYSLVEVIMSPSTTRVGMVRPLTSYSNPITPNTSEKPRVYLPRPALVAFVTFDRAVVVASMAAPPDSPDSQLQEDSHIIPATFEDVIDFREEGALQIVGSGIEEPTTNGHLQEDVRAHRHKTKNPTTVLLLQGFGTVRVAITDIDRFASEKPPEVTPKSKLEQAVFFGIRDDNPLVFQGRRDLPFSNKEIGDAAIELSHEIVSSKTPFIANLPASLENNMKTRVGYLNRLIAHLNALKIDLDTRTRWILLYNSEKMAVATWLWQKHEQFLAERPKSDKKNLISETVLYINEQQKTEPNAAIGEVDPVRHWFINDVWRLDIFIAWGYQIIKYYWTKHLADEEGINRLVWEAVMVNNGALDEARQHRMQNARLYGVNPSQPTSPSGNAALVLPEPWTATHFITNNLKRLVEFSFQWLDSYYVLSPETTPVKRKLLEDIRDTMPSLTNRYLEALVEYSSWAAAKTDDPQVQELGQKYEKTYKQDVYEKILKLKDYNLWDDAISLAKSHSAFDALADVMVQQIISLEQGALASGIAAAKGNDGMKLAEEKKKEMGALFVEYEKEQFAYKVYKSLLESSGIQAVLDFKYDERGYATGFLRTRPELAKISWINDVERENDVERAAETLLNLGMDREMQVWSKKIELSLSKLALLAEEEKQQQQGSESGEVGSMEKIDEQLEIIRIQDGLYSQMLPTIQEAVDEAAEQELAVKEHGVLIPKKLKALAQIFDDGMGRLIRHEALDPLTLIDLLTLIALDPNHIDIMGDQFFLALKVARYGIKSTAERTDVERLIWRRCFIRDDWKAVNETNEKADEDQLSIVGQTAAYHTLFAVIEEREYFLSFWIEKNELLMLRNRTQGRLLQAFRQALGRPRCVHGDARPPVGGTGRQFPQQAARGYEG